MYCFTDTNHIYPVFVHAGTKSKISILVCNYMIKAKYMPKTIIQSNENNIKKSDKMRT